MTAARGKFDDTLRRMLATPPKPHTAAAKRKTRKASRKSRKSRKKKSA